VKLFFAVNVVLDVLTGRTPWAADSAAALSLIDSSDVEGLVAAHTITTLHYLTNRHLDRQRANSAVADLMTLFSITPVDEAALLQALSIPAADFEDAVQAACALRAGADRFITRNPRDFRGLGLLVLTPAELLALRATTDPDE
jgi:predicted nucleic acid-binding protein